MPLACLPALILQFQIIAVNICKAEYAFGGAVGRIIIIRKYLFVSISYRGINFAVKCVALCILLSCAFLCSCGNNSVFTNGNDIVPVKLKVSSKYSLKRRYRPTFPRIAKAPVTI